MKFFTPRKISLSLRERQGGKQIKIENKINITERCEKANKRQEFGHFEADTIL